MYPSTTASTSTVNPPPPQQPSPRAPSPTPYATQHLRAHASETLLSYERLSWHATQRNESLAQTRLHFLSLLSGFSESDEEALVDWKVDFSPVVYGNANGRGGSSAGKGKERERDRASLGGAGGGSPASGSGSGRKKRRSGAGG